jgi:hypothetical protein
MRSTTRKRARISASGVPGDSRKFAESCRRRYLQLSVIAKRFLDCEKVELLRMLLLLCIEFAMTFSGVKVCQNVADSPSFWRLDKNRSSRTTTRPSPSSRAICTVSSSLSLAAFISCLSHLAVAYHCLEPHTRPASSSQHSVAALHLPTSRPAPTNIARTCLRAIANAGVA